MIKYLWIEKIDEDSEVRVHFSEYSGKFVVQVHNLSGPSPFSDTYPNIDYAIKRAQTLSVELRPQ